MKNKSLHYFIQSLLICGAITMLIPSCQPYEEGPSISFRSAEKRIYGSYQVKEYTVEGADSLSLFESVFGGTGCEFYYNDISATPAFAISGGSKLYWHWHFSADEMEILIDEATGLTDGTGPLSRGITLNWDILMLKKKKIRIRTTYNNKEYKLYMEDNS